MRQALTATAPTDLEQIWIASGREYLAAAVIHPRAAGRRRALVFLHGWTCWKDERDYAHVKIARRLAAGGAGSCLLFDFRGHGESTGDLARTLPDDLLRDAQAAMLWAREQLRPDELVLVTAGIGARIALACAAAGGVGGLVLLSPAFSLPPVLREVRLGETAALIELQHEARRLGLAQPYREALFHVGVLPDHAAPEVVPAAFLDHPLLAGDPQPLLDACVCPMLACFDPAAPLLDTPYLANRPSVRLAPIEGGGPLFRHPQLIDQVADTILGWLGPSA